MNNLTWQMIYDDNNEYQKSNVTEQQSFSLSLQIKLFIWL